MWINTQIGQSQTQEQAHMAKIAHIEGNLVNTISHIQSINVPVISNFGVSAMPNIGDEVVLIPMIDGGYCCIGKATVGSEGDVKISAASGAYIHLMADGRISLNGLIVSKEGEIV